MGKSLEIRGGEVEREPMRDRVVLITGGGAGTGLEIAKELDSLGATVVIGTRNLPTPGRKQTHFQTVCEVLRQEPIPFIADLTRPEEIRTAITALKERRINQFTDVVCCAAGGIEKPKIAVAREIIALRRIKRGGGEIPQEEIDRARGVIEETISSDLSLARNINVVALQELVEELREKNMIGKGHKANLVYLSSLPSSFFNQEGVPIPSFYRGVAQTKHEAEVWLSNNADVLAGEGITTTIVSGDVIGDSAIGDLYNTIAGIFYSEDEIKARPPFITKAQMARSIIKMLMSKRRLDQPVPRRDFVLGDQRLSPLEILNYRALPL